MKKALMIIEYGENNVRREVEILGTSQKIK